MEKTTAASLEQAFAIGRPAPSAAYKTCTRCKGTGWWQLARKCFKCGGRGHAEVVTLATKIRDKRAHIAEVRSMIEDATERLRPPLRPLGRSQMEAHLALDIVNLAQLEADLATLEGA